MDHMRISGTESSSIILSAYSTVDCLIFVGYQFSWLSWRVTKSSTPEKAIFCMNSSSLANIPIRFFPLPLGGFSYASKTSAWTPSGIRELSFLTSVL